MLINKGQCYILGLVLAATLSANLQSASALNTEPVNELENSATSLSTDQISTPDSTFAPLAITGLQMFNSKQYNPKSLLILLNHNLNPTAILPNYNEGFFQNINTMPVAMEEVIADFTISKYDKTPVTANKVFISNHHEKEIKSRENILTPEESQSNKIQNSPEQNRRYAANSQDLKRGKLVSTNYNAVSMLRTMEDLQNIGYLGMSDVSTEPRSDALTRELKETTYVAFVPENSCVNLVDLKLLAACQNKNLEKKAATMPMIQDKTWSAQMTKDFSFWQSMNISTQRISK